MGDGPECIFFTGKQAGGIVSRIRALTGLEEVPTTAQIIMLDIPDNGGFYVAGDTSVNTENIRGFLEDYKNKSLSDSSSSPKRHLLYTHIPLSYFISMFCVIDTSPSPSRRPQARTGAEFRNSARTELYEVNRKKGGSSLKLK